MKNKELFFIFLFLVDLKKWPRYKIVYKVVSSYQQKCKKENKYSKDEKFQMKQKKLAEYCE